MPFILSSYACFSSVSIYLDNYSIAHTAIDLKSRMILTKIE